MPWDPVAVAAAVAAVRREEAAVRDFVWDTTNFVVEGGELRVEGEVLVPSQAGRYRRALLALGEELPPEIPVRTRLDRAWTEFEWRRVVGGAPLDLHRGAVGEALQAQVAPGQRVRFLADRVERSLVQGIDGTLGWAERSRLVAEAPPSDPWRNTLRAREGSALPGGPAVVAQVVASARAELGAPYRLGACGGEGWDCSGLVQAAFVRGAGLWLPKHTTDQLRFGVRVPEAGLAPGDLLFVQGRERRLNHVGLVADGVRGVRVVHACLSRGQVVDEPIGVFLARYRYVGGRRVLEAAATLAEGAAANRGPEPAMLRALRGKRIHVVGASSAEGAAVLLYLAGEHGFAGLVGHDFAADALHFARSFRRANGGYERDVREAMLAQLRRLPVELRLGERYLDGISQAEVIVASQNWFNYPPNHPRLDLAVAEGARLVLQTELALGIFPGLRVGVTGSNGKSTTTAMVTWLLGHGGGTVIQGGNDRDRQVPLLRLEQANANDRLVWEVSNRHLRSRALELDVAVLTNVSRNHVEDHGSFEAYQEAKGRIFGHMGPGRHGVIWALDGGARRFVGDLRATGAAVWLAGAGPGDGVVRPEDGLLWVEGSEVYVRPPRGHGLGPFHRPWALSLPGTHNEANALCAAAAALAAGATPGDLDALGSFPALPGRNELVATRNGVRWVNDLSSTTAPSTEAALLAEQVAGRRVVLIMGGEDKGMDWTGMADAASTACITVLALPGSGTEAFISVLGERVPVERVADADTAIARADVLAPPGATVLLSPGAAFFQSRFLDGGSSFGSRVRALPEGA